MTLHLSTPDPAFNPRREIVVNGYPFAPTLDLIGTAAGVNRQNGDRNIFVGTSAGAINSASPSENPSTGVTAADFAEALQVECEPFELGPDREGVAFARGFAWGAGLSLPLWAAIAWIGGLLT